MSVMLGVLAAFGLAGCAEPKIPPGLGDEEISVPQMLQVYATLTGKTVLVSRDVRQDQKRLVFRNPKSLTRTEARKLLEQDLQEQAGIIILHQDRKTVDFGFPATEKFEP